MTKNILLLCLIGLSNVAFGANGDFYFGATASSTNVTNAFKSHEEETGLDWVYGSRILRSQTTDYTVDRNTVYSAAIFGGYHFNQSLAIELGLFKQGSFNITSHYVRTYSDQSSSNGVSSFKFSTYAAILSAVLSKEVAPRFSIFLKPGIAWTHQQERTVTPEVNIPNINPNVRSFNFDTSIDVQTQRYIGLSFGLGGDYQLSKHFDTRLAMTDIELRYGREIDTGLSLAYRF